MFKTNSRIGSLFSLLILGLVVYFASKNLKNIEQFVQSSGIVGPLVVVLLYGILSVTPISADPLTVVSGVMFGPFWGIVVGWMGNNLGAMLEYYFGSRLVSESSLRRNKENLPFGLGSLPVNSLWFLIIGRLIPVFGGKLISLLAGIYHVPIKRFAWTTIIVNLIGSILLSFGGYNLIHLSRL